MEEPVTDLSWEDFLSQFKESKLRVAFGNAEAINAARAGLTHPNSNVFFYSGFIVLIGSIVCSFIFYWWSFIPGIFLFIWLLGEAKRENSRALLNGILSNKNIYETALKYRLIYIYKQ